MDARPSDVFALAVRTGAPIYIAEDVFDRAGAKVPLEIQSSPELDAEFANLEQIAADLVRASDKIAKQRPALQTTYDAEEISDRMKSAARGIIGQVFGNSG